MLQFRYYFPIQVRYSDLDPQWHVNNTRYLAYIEQARFAYYVALGLFDGKSFHDLPSIVADVHIQYLAAILFGQEIRVGVRISRLGNKSFTTQVQIEGTASEQVHAKAEIIVVAYDYRAGKSIPIPEKWRSTISSFESIPAGPTPI